MAMTAAISGLGQVSPEVAVPSPGRARYGGMGYAPRGVFPCSRTCLGVGGSSLRAHSRASPSIPRELGALSPASTQSGHTHGSRCCRAPLLLPGSWVAVRAGSRPRLTVMQSTSAPAAPTETSSTTPNAEETDVEVVRLTKDTLTLRGKSTQRLKFEVEYGLQAGTTENSYAIQGATATALIDVPDQAFARAFCEAVASNVDLERLQYLIVGHISPKRVESVAQLARLLHSKSGGKKGLKVVCSNPAAQVLSGALPPDLLEAPAPSEDAPVAPIVDLVVVRPGDTLDLGGGHNLEFILTPTPRWPDGMVTYDPANRLLFSQKLFSAHVCRDDVYDVGGLDVYGEHWRFFYDCMLAPVAKQIETVLRRVPIEAVFAPPSYAGKTGLGVLKADLGYIWSSVLSRLNLNLDTTAAVLPSAQGASKEGLTTAAICPLHGPVVRSSLTELVREYKEWTAERVKQAEEATVAVLFASAYGNTSALAQALSRGLLRGGVGVESINCEQSSAEDISAAVRRCAGFAVGSPTLGGFMPTPVQEALGIILEDTEARAKPAGVFGSFGWSGEAVDELEKRLKDGGFSLVFPSIRCKFKPTEAMLQVCEESGRDLARSVKRLQAKARAKEAVSPSTFAASAASGAQQAVGRVVGSLCVVSAVKGDAESAMLASWVSQASFAPPGITVAVAKERALESLVLPGSSFAVSVLGENKVGPISKQLLKPFAPGEPRFGDLRVRKGSNGATILEDAIAALECTVQSRMETGDHWVLYATVDEGQLLDDKGLTAIHHRKLGTRY